MAMGKVQKQILEFFQERGGEKKWWMNQEIAAELDLPVRRVHKSTMLLSQARALHGPLLHRKQRGHGVGYRLTEEGEGFDVKEYSKGPRPIDAVTSAQVRTFYQDDLGEPQRAKDSRRYPNHGIARMYALSGSQAVVVITVHSDGGVFEANYEYGKDNFIGEVSSSDLGTRTHPIIQPRFNHSLAQTTQEAPATR